MLNMELRKVVNYLSSLRPTSKAPLLIEVERRKHVYDLVICV